MKSFIPRKLLGDAREKLNELDAGSVQVCITSPPYYGMRSYLPVDHPMKNFEIGSELYFDAYLDNLRDVFRCVRRVMRDDGTMWINLGDRYTNGARQTYASGGRNGQVTGHHDKFIGTRRPKDPDGLKAKDLCMVPARVAIALQDDGWYLRSQVPWIKRNCVPESAEDRPATALEYFFLFSKSEHYFYDRFPVMMPVSGTAHPRSANGSRMLNENPPSQGQRRRHASEFAWHGKGRKPGVGPKSMANTQGSKQNESMQSSLVGMVTQRNRRNTDWFMQSWQGMLTDDEGDPLAFVVNPRGTVLEHFAAYPPELVKPCILASTSEAGCCPTCGSSLVRIVEDGEADLEHQKACGGDELGLYHGKARKDYDGNKVQNASDMKRRILASMVEKKTTGWTFTCGCRIAPPVPSVVLDPFHGSGSTAEAAVSLGRQYVGCELNEAYFKLSDSRDGQGGLVLL